MAAVLLAVAVSCKRSSIYGSCPPFLFSYRHPGISWSCKSYTLMILKWVSIMGASTFRKRNLSVSLSSSCTRLSIGSALNLCTVYNLKHLLVNLLTILAWTAGYCAGWCVFSFRRRVDTVSNFLHCKYACQLGWNMSATIVR